MCPKGYFCINVAGDEVEQKNKNRNYMLVKYAVIDNMG